MPSFAFLTSLPIWALSISTCLLCGCANRLPFQQARLPDHWPSATQRMATPNPSPALETTASKSGHHWLQVGRYHTINAVPTKEQQALLQVIIEVTLPEEVGDIQSAVDYLLLRSGYQFTALPLADDIQQLLQKPIPAVHRHLGPMTLESALQTLAGEPFQLTIDPVHRQVGYQLPAPNARQVYP